MSISALYLHELHHRMTSFRRNTATPGNVFGAGQSADLPRRASLSELDEENIAAQADQDQGAATNRLASSTMA